MRERSMTARAKKNSHRVMTATGNNSRATPQFIYDWLDGMMHFTIDVCADAKNHKHARYFDERDNGLAQSWADETTFGNYPYGRQLPDWMRKARDTAMLQRGMGVSVIPVRAGSEWWKHYVKQIDGKAGKLRDVRVMPHYDLTWCRFEKLTVGVYCHDQRIPFDGMETGAPFDAAFIFMGHPSRRPVKPRILSSLPAGRDWPLLTEGWL